MFPPIVFFVAKGADGSCGRGCNIWIAAEGQIDADAAERFRKFIKPLRDRHLPIYFSSPGGNLEQAFAIGNMLRQKPTVARIGRTVVRECGESQVSETCLKLKKSGQELEAELSERQVMCNSACPFIMMGATTREIAADATLGIHSPKVILRYHGRVTARMIEEATDRGRNRLDRLTSSYLSKMGIDHGLLELQRTVKFEDKHFLTREELARFRIDTRPLVESPWTFVSNIGSMFHKLIFVKKTDSPAFRKEEVRLFCKGGDRGLLMFIREFDTGAASKLSVALMGGAEKFTLAKYPLQGGAYEAWTTNISADSMKAIAASVHLQVAVNSTAPDGTPQEEKLDLDNFGLETGWKQLLASCADQANHLSKAAPTAASNPLPGAISPYPNLKNPFSTTPSRAPIVGVPALISVPAAAPAALAPAMTTPASTVTAPSSSPVAGK